MGTICHHFIIVTSQTERAIERAHAAAHEIFDPPSESTPADELEDALPLCAVSPILASSHNGFRHFMVTPDGSKEGWAGSHEGDARRDRFMAWMKAHEPSALAIEVEDHEAGDPEVTRWA